MRSLNKLTIRGAAPQIARLLGELDRFLTGGWRRDAEAESRLQRMGIRGGATYCYACPATERRPAAALWLQARGDNELHVSNIVPQSKRELTEDEYNGLLAEFESTILRPANVGVGAVIELEHPRTTLEMYLSHEAVRRLESFSATANKNILHPADYRRWQDFIVQSHLERVGLDPSLLKQWLAEQGWPEDQQQHLANDYESVRSVLAAYDEERLEKCLP